MSQFRSPVNPGAPVGGMNRVDANGDPCVIRLDGENAEDDGIPEESDECKKLLEREGREDDVIPGVDGVDDGNVVLRECLGVPERKADTQVEESRDNVPCAGGHVG